MTRGAVCNRSGNISESSSELVLSIFISFHIFVLSFNILSVNMNKCNLLYVIEIRHLNFDRNKNAHSRKHFANEKAFLYYIFDMNLCGCIFITPHCVSTSSLIRKLKTPQSICSHCLSRDERTSVENAQRRYKIGRSELLNAKLPVIK